MTITIIIATRDRARLLGETLAALQLQEPAGQRVEILVVDNASSDNTAEIVNAAGRLGPIPVTYVRELRAGKSYALNTAIENARGDLLLLTDDDVLPAPGWIAGYVRAFAETGADYAAGRILPLWEAPPPVWMSSALYGVLAVPDGGTVRLPLAKGINEQIMPIGANMAVRRAVVDRIGGWNPALGKLQGTLRTGEDHEFALRMSAAGFRGVYEPQAWVRHRVSAERLQRVYFQRWFYDNGTIVAGLEEDFPTTDRYLLRVPRYLWRQAASEAVAGARAVLMGDIRRSTAARMRLGWFAGYVRGRRALRRPSAGRSTPSRRAAATRGSS